MTQTLTAAALLTLAPFGARVRWSDGTPRPPERFTKKLSAWKTKNAEGLFLEVRPDGPYPSFTLREGVYMASDGSTPVIILNRTFSPGSDLTFEVVEPAPAAVVVEDKDKIAPGWLSLVPKAPHGDAAACRAFIEAEAASRTLAFPYVVRTQ